MEGKKRKRSYNTPIAAVFMGIEMFGSDGAIFYLWFV